MAGWCTIESDPMVFNEMLEKMGVKGVEVVEIPCLDIEEIKRFGAIYGLIFLFKWKPVKRDVEILTDAQHVYFAKQIVQNACATQAIINILLNRDDVDCGTALKEFKEFTGPLSADQRGECLGAHETIRDVHNSFARTQCFTFEGSASEDDDAYHFTAYIPKCGAVYELDGLQDGPINAGASSEEDWLEAAVPLLRERVEFVQKSDTKGNGLMFSLLAITKDRIGELEKKLEQNEKELMSDQQMEMRAQIQDLKEAKEKGRRENVRRRHNYIPLIVAMLKGLAEKGVLKDEADAALKRAEERKAAKKD
eukprot:Rhum_TRINITY_DN25282_c0_g2::Rhum_TRINITY_DN25282_c0_g2_i1::g.181722::m.181722/K05610/UCHL5, UCH37; ubiquitin carboxyl-terminal hydrolase L5